jgi:hypothetical protein
MSICKSRRAAVVLLCIVHSDAYFSSQNESDKKGLYYYSEEGWEGRRDGVQRRGRLREGACWEGRRESQ